MSNRLQSELDVRVYRVNAASTVEICVAPDGEVKSRQGTFIVDQDAFDAINERFIKHGTDLVVDYEHQTVGGEMASPDGTAPAAGWIKSLRYEPGRGIIAKVEWTSRAQKMIEDGEYRYFSPVVLIRKNDRKAVALHSVALTNKPAIGHLEELVAKELGIMPKEKTKTQANQEGEVTEGQGDPMLALARIAEALGLQDVPNEAGAIAEAVLAKIRELMAGEGGEEGEGAEGGEEAAAAKEGLGKIASRLGVTGNATVETVIARIDEMKAGTVPADRYKAIEAKVADLEGKELDRVVASAVGGAIKAGKINPNATADVKYWTTACRENPEQFERLMAKAPKVWPGESTTGSAYSAAASPGDARTQLIKKYKDEWEANRDQPQLEQLACWAFVKSSLECDGHETLTASEQEALTAKEVK